MRPTFLISSAFFCLAAVAVHADPTSDARKAIQAQYDKVSAAAARKDMAGIVAVETPNHVNIDKYGQKHDDAVLRQQFEPILRAAKSVKVVSRIQTIMLSKSGATVTIAEHLEIILPNPQTGKISHYISDNTSREFWVKTQDGWKQKQSRQLTSRTTVDGKPQP